MRRILVVLVLLLILAVLAGAETFYVHLEEARDANNSLYDLPVREGLFNGLFELDHVVFDNAGALNGAEVPAAGPRSQAALNALIDEAANGGASYLLTVTITSQSEPLSERLRRIRSRAVYYCYRVREETLVGKGELSEDNWGREEALTQEKVGLLLGEALSHEVDRICSKR
jgi:hypothetical protein